VSTRDAGRRQSDATVSVVVVDDGSGTLADTLAALGACDLPAHDLDVVVVSTGDRRDPATSEALPAGTRIVPAGADSSLSAARNTGADMARGAWLAFLGTGCHPDPAWLRQALVALDGDSTLTCVASSITAPDGSSPWSPSVSFTGRPSPPGQVRPPGHAGQAPRSGHAGQAPPDVAGRPRDVLWASADAMVVRADAFAAAGGFDPTYEGVLDDLDLGWRLWLGGGRVALVPSSAARRATVVPSDDAGAHFLRERNGLFTIFKNYDDASLAVALPAALALGIHRAASDGGDAAPTATSSVPLSSELAASARAVDAFVRALPDLLEARRQVQARRSRSDVELLPLIELPPSPSGDGTPLPPEVAVGEALGAQKHFGARRRIVVATCDAITPKMAGPAIRAWQIASALAAEHDVVLVTTGIATLSDAAFDVRVVDDRRLAELERWCDVFIFQGWVVTNRPYLLSSSKVLVADIYDPLHLEQLEQGRDAGEDARRRDVRNATEVLNEQLLRGDFFLCANSKQRDFWLGQLAALGRVNTYTYDEDPTLESLISIVAFGISDAAPTHTRPAVKGVIPGIGPDDKLILWGGGVYNWFDPLTLLRAVDRLRRRQPAVRLLFMGLRHPNPEIPEMRMATATRALADELGLSGSHVFFNEGWVPYDDRQNYLLEADIGVSTHLAHLETALSSRTRILDYVWASLPVVATEGDTLATMVADQGLGLTVPPGDVDALEEALFRLLDDEGFAKSCRENAVALAPDLAWSRVLQPLVEFCRRPRRAPDLLGPSAPDGRPPLVPTLRASGWRNDLRIGVAHLRHGGPVLLAAKAWSRVRERLR